MRSSTSNKLDALFNILLELGQASFDQFLLSGGDVAHRMDLGHTAGLHQTRSGEYMRQRPELNKHARRAQRPS
jgi:hypothetical protein